MSLSEQATVLAPAEKNGSTSLVCVTELSLEEIFSDAIFTDFGVCSPVVFGGTEWDDDDLSHEDLRRPPMRKDHTIQPTLSAKDEVEMREVQLHKDEKARQRELEDLMSKSEVKAKLDDEFGERRRQLQRELDALPC